MLLTIEKILILYIIIKKELYFLQIISYEKEKLSQDFVEKR